MYRYSFLLVNLCSKSQEKKSLINCFYTKTLNKKKMLDYNVDFCKKNKILVEFVATSAGFDLTDRLAARFRFG